MGAIKQGGGGGGGKQGGGGGGGGGRAIKRGGASAPNAPPPPPPPPPTPLRLRLRVSGDITITMEPWTFRSGSNKHGSTKKNIDFPPPVGSDTKVSFPAVMLCT